MWNLNSGLRNNRWRYATSTGIMRLATMCRLTVYFRSGVNFFVSSCVPAQNHWYRSLGLESIIVSDIPNVPGRNWLSTIRCALVVQVFTVYATVSPVERVIPRETLADGMWPSCMEALPVIEVPLLLVILKAVDGFDSGLIMSASSLEFSYRRQISWKYNSWPSLRQSAEATEKIVLWPCPWVII